MYGILGPQQRTYRDVFRRPSRWFWEGAVVPSECVALGTQASLCWNRLLADRLGCKPCPQNWGAISERESIVKPHRYCFCQSKKYPSYDLMRPQWNIRSIVDENILMQHMTAFLYSVPSHSSIHVSVYITLYQWLYLYRNC